jgi:hypothetical protein
MRARLKAERRGRRWWWAAGTSALAAAAAVAIFVLAPRGTTGDAEDPFPGAEPEMLAQLDLLENYNEVEAFDGLQDEETFDLVASLDDLSPEHQP